MDSNVLHKFVYVFLDESITCMRSKVCNNVFQDERISRIDVLRTELGQKIFSRSGTSVQLRRYAELSVAGRIGEEAKRVHYLMDVHLLEKLNDGAVHVPKR